MTEATKVNVADQQVSQIPDELADSKLYEKFAKEFGEEGAREFFRRSENEIRAVLAECAIQKAEAVAARDETASYKQAVSVVSDFNKATRDTVKPLDLKIKAGTAIMAYRNALKGK